MATAEDDEGELAIIIPKGMIVPSQVGPPPPEPLFVRHHHSDL